MNVKLWAEIWVLRLVIRLDAKFGHGQQAPKDPMTYA